VKSTKFQCKCSNADAITLQARVSCTKVRTRKRGKIRAYFVCKGFGRACLIYDKPINE